MGMNRLFQFGVLTALLLAMLSIPEVGAQEEAAADPVAETDTVETTDAEAAETSTEEEIAETADTEDAMTANGGLDTPPESEVNAADYWSAYETDPIAWTLNNLWIMICGCLVFIMHLGFASLECGLTRQKKYNQYSF
jgi:hypothetical protein